ncbi:MAG: lycopene cyclase domain-containing protein [Cyclobacteriaceae bacterium]|nr:lycopene cyclase domain-containing protein [Cyclobacteriaceae bacterium HetDA_MAG_MS6]
MSLYLTIHVFVISFPLLRSFEYRVKYYTKWAPLGLALLMTGLLFITWDVIFTEMGVWGFNPIYLSGYYVLNLPIEEWLFFVTAPFSSIFIYENVVYFIKKPISNTVTHKIFLIAGVVLIILSIIFQDRTYTFINFLGTGTLLLIHARFIKANYAGHFLIAYLIHLLPFMITNGVLTGSFIDEPIVWYNNSENLGIRLVTVPVEDLMYALFLLLLAITFYEYFKKRLSGRT